MVQTGTQGSLISMSESARFSDRSSRVRLEVHGPDRAKFLHNLTTNDVKRLPAGKGHESGQIVGKTVIPFIDHAAVAKALAQAAKGGRA